MNRLVGLGAALIAGGLATIAPAAGGSAISPVATPVRRIASPPPATGGWTREGWSDAAPVSRGSDVAQTARTTPIAATAPASRATSPAAMPRQPVWREDRPLDDATPAGEWRRQTWDGGLGDGYLYRRGGRLPGIFSAPAYVVRDWRGHDLPRPGPGMRWVRYYDDAVLLDRNGVIVDAVSEMGWSDGGYDGGYTQPYRGPDDYRTPQRPVIVHSGPGPAPQVTYAPDGSATIVIRTTPGVATTTTTVEEVPAPRARATRRR